MLGATSFDEVWSRTVSPTFYKRAITALVHTLESAFEARFVYDNRDIPFGHADLLDLFLLAQKLVTHKVIHSYRPESRYADEVPSYQWRAQCITDSDFGELLVGSGGSLENDREALTKTLAEAIERHVWAAHIDYFVSPQTATFENMRHRGPAIAPERFAGFPHSAQSSTPERTFADPRYLWIQAQSHISKTPVWLPAQTVSGKMGSLFAAEPLIRGRTTSGCAVYPTQSGAVLNGALELIERDAYMIMWLNQLTLPRIDLVQLASKSPRLAAALAKCARYRLQPHAIRMLTDAPTYAICVVIEDSSDTAPKLTLGMNAHRNLASAVEGALEEALRIRKVARFMQQNESPEVKKRNANEVGHLDRLLYWMNDDRHKRLSFLIEGPVHEFEEPWEQDSDEEHLARIVAWCRSRGYEFATVSMSQSAGNPTPWQIEMVVIPELQPIHLTERMRHLAGARLHEIPEQFGYQALAEPYSTDPHPFA